MPLQARLLLSINHTLAGESYSNPQAQPSIYSQFTYQISSASAFKGQLMPSTRPILCFSAPLRHFLTAYPFKPFNTSIRQAHTSMAKPKVTVQALALPSQIPRLVEINQSAMAPDLLSKWMELYTPRSEAEGARRDLQGLFNEKGKVRNDVNGRCYFASIRVDVGARAESIAASPPSNSEGPTKEENEGAEEAIAGFIYYEEGIHVNVPALRGDDEPQPQPDSITKETSTLSPSQTHQRNLATGDQIYAASRQHYIRTIQHRRHIFIRRLMVDPAYQGRGVGVALLRHVTARTDEQAMPCWLYSRPAGVGLYEKMGFRDSGVTVLETEELKGVAESLGMVRWESVREEGGAWEG